MGKIFYIMGKSASGKDSIYEYFLRETKLFRKIVLYTTRPVRQGELNGVDYFFVGEEELKNLEQQGVVIERRDYHTVKGNWTYFTVKDETIDLKASDYLAVGTLESYLKMKEYYGEEALCPVYIEVEDGERLSRAIEREKKQKVPQYEEMCRRFLADQRDFSEENLSAARINRRFVNDSFSRCVREIYDYIMNQKYE